MADTGAEGPSLASFFTLLARWRWLSVSVLVLSIVTAGAANAATPARYEATASLLALNEEPAILGLLTSERFAQAVLANHGLADAFPGPDGPLNLLRAAPVGGFPGDEDPLVRVRATHTSPGIATAIARGFVEELPRWRGELENVTRTSQRATYLVDADYDENLTEKRLDDLVRGLAYYEVLDSPTAARRTSATLPLALVLGAVVGAGLAVFAPVVVEAARAAAGRGGR